MCDDTDLKFGVDEHWCNVVEQDALHWLYVYFVFNTNLFIKCMVKNTFVAVQ